MWAGAAGAAPATCGTSQPCCCQHDQAQQPVPCRSYMRVEANATHMVHSVLSSYDGSLMDRFTLTKPPGWRFRPRPVSLDIKRSQAAADGSSVSGGRPLSGSWARLFGRMGGGGAPAAVA